MTSRPSQLSPQNDSAMAQRRRQILAELDIDVWSVRPAQVAVPQATGGSASLSASAEPAAKPPGRPLAAGSGPAAARALLAESAKSPGTTIAERSAVSAESGGTRPAPMQAKAGTEPGADNELGQGLDLLCLSGTHGLLLVPQRGLSPPAKRLLQDILASAIRLIGNRLRATTQADELPPVGRTKLQSLRFAWPPAVEQGEPAADPDANAGMRDTTRALRGFLNRQLQDKTQPVLIYVANDEDDGDVLTQLLGQLELPIDLGRRVPIVAPERLMSDSSLKRVLWQTLSSL